MGTRTVRLDNEAEKSLESLRRDFAQAINLNPFRIADRLWTKTTLDPEEEKLRIPHGLQSPGT